MCHLWSGTSVLFDYLIDCSRYAQSVELEWSAGISEGSATLNCGNDSGNGDSDASESVIVGCDGE